MSPIIAGISNGIGFFFLLIVLSYYALFFIHVKKPAIECRFTSVTVLIPAHNEGQHIRECITSVVEAQFEGKKEIIIIDDGSTDDTYEKACSFKGHQLTVLQTSHQGKSAAINLALQRASGEAIAIVDADSVIGPLSLQSMADELGRHNTGACTGIVKVRNRKRFLCIWLHMEQLYANLMRQLFAKLNANIVTPGPLSVYRRSALTHIGGFSTKGYSEDVDVTIRLIRAGYRIGYSESSSVETYMPDTIKGFVSQRTRFAKGTLNIFRRHLRLNSTVIDMYTLPLQVFMYMQAVIMAPINIYQILSGYFQYFYSYGVYFNGGVFLYFFNWLSLVGFLQWVMSVLNGMVSLSPLALMGLVSALLSYPLYFYAAVKYDGTVTIHHATAIMFMFPFWLVVMFIYLFSLPALLSDDQYNSWKKNE